MNWVVVAEICFIGGVFAIAVAINVKFPPGDGVLWDGYLDFGGPHHEAAPARNIEHDPEFKRIATELEKAIDEMLVAETERIRAFARKEDA